MHIQIFNKQLAQKNLERIDWIKIACVLVVFSLIFSILIPQRAGAQEIGDVVWSKLFKSANKQAGIKNFPTDNHGGMTFTALTQNHQYVYTARGWLGFFQGYSSIQKWRKVGNSLVFVKSIPGAFGSSGIYNMGVSGGVLRVYSIDYTSEGVQDYMEWRDPETLQLIPPGRLPGILYPNGQAFLTAKGSGYWWSKLRGTLDAINYVQVYPVQPIYGGSVNGIYLSGTKGVYKGSDLSPDWPVSVGPDRPPMKPAWWYFGPEAAELDSSDSNYLWVAGGYMGSFDLWGSSRIEKRYVGLGLPPTTPAIGHFDSVNPTTCSVKGWAFDGDSPASSISVRVYRDGQMGSGGTLVTTCPANQSRPDVNSAHSITGNHGFNCILPASYIGTGNHQLYIHAMDTNGTPNNVIAASPKSLECPAALPPPATPANLTANPGLCGSGRITLSWNPVVGATGYDIYDNNALIQADVPINSYIHQPLVAGSNHSYRVVAKNLSGESAPTAQVLATAPVLCPTLVNLTAPSCIIALNSSTCNSTVSWSSSNTTNPSVRQSGIQFSIAASSLGTSRVLQRGSHTFRFYDNGIQLGGDAIATADCDPSDPDIVWNGTACVYPPEATISATSCTLNVGDTTCNTTVTWTSNNFLGNASVGQGGTEFSTNSDDSEIRSVDPDNRTFTILDTGGNYSKSTSATINYAGGCAWNGAVCAPPPPTIDVSLSRDVIRANETTDVTAEVSANYPLSCTIYNAESSTVDFTHDGGAVPSTKTVTTRPLTSTQVITVGCEPNPAIPGVPPTLGEARVEVIPSIQEI